jgi:glutamine---fructose-6-phosphate transaminase (isomerizing)
MDMDHKVTETLMWKEILEQPEVFRRLLARQLPVVRAVAAEADRRSVHSVVVAARGTSDHAGTFAQYLLEIRKGVPVSLAAPSVLTLYHGALDLKDSLVVGISQSGRAEDVLEVMKRGKASGGQVVAITNDPHSPMAVFADYQIDLDAGLERSVAATKTFGAQMFVASLLAAVWAGDDVALARLAEVPGFVEETVRLLPPQLDRIVPQYRFLEEGFVLARGVGYPVAMEMALKIQETNYIRMRAFPVSDFYHGPMAMLHAGFPVVLFAAEGPAYRNAREMAALIGEKASDLLWVTDGDPQDDGMIEDLFEKTGASCRIVHLPRTGDDTISAFLYAVFAQMFACQLAVVRGLDPDRPRTLSKVTITR